MASEDMSAEKVLNFEDLVREHLGSPPKGGNDNFVSLDTVRPEKPQFLWEPYFRLKHINIVEARGSSGKSTFLMALAASLSHGRLPFGGECDPVRTLYLGREDDPGELSERFQTLDGRTDMMLALRPEKLYLLDPKGQARLHDDIVETGAANIIIDTAKDFLPPYIANEFETVKISKWIGEIRQIARSTNSGITIVRHWRTETKGNTPLAHRGAGGDQWRNSSRSQLALVRHPERPAIEEYVGVIPLRGSINARCGPPFGFSNEGGEFSWIAPDAFDIEAFEEAFDLGQASQGGKQASAKRYNEIVAFLKETVPFQGSMLVKDLEVLARERQITPSGGTWTRAKKDTCLTIKIKDAWWIYQIGGDPFAD